MLYENDTDFEKRVIDPRNEADRAELQAIWLLHKHTVIRDDARNRGVPENTGLKIATNRFAGQLRDYASQ